MWKVTTSSIIRSASWTAAATTSRPGLSLTRCSSWFSTTQVLTQSSLTTESRCETRCCLLMLILVFQKVICSCQNALKFILGNILGIFFGLTLVNLLDNVVFICNTLTQMRLNIWKPCTRAAEKHLKVFEGLCISTPPIWFNKLHQWCKASNYVIYINDLLKVRVTALNERGTWTTKARALWSGCGKAQVKNIWRIALPTFHLKRETDRCCHGEMCDGRDRAVTQRPRLHKPRRKPPFCLVSISFNWSRVH